jgi:hypothetical protein
MTEQEIRDRLIITEDPATGQKRMSIIDGPKRGLMPQVSWATFVPAVVALALMLGVEVFVHFVISPTSPEHTSPSVNQR